MDVLFWSSFSNSESGSAELIGVGSGRGGGGVVKAGAGVVVGGCEIAVGWPVVPAGTRDPGPMPSPSRAAFRENSRLMRRVGSVAEAGVIGLVSVASGLSEAFQGMGREGRLAESARGFGGAVWMSGSVAVMLEGTSGPLLDWVVVADGSGSMRRGVSGGSSGLVELVRPGSDRGESAVTDAVAVFVAVLAVAVLRLGAGRNQVEATVATASTTIALPTITTGDGPLFLGRRPSGAADFFARFLRLLPRERPGAAWSSNTGKPAAPTGGVTGVCARAASGADSGGSATGSAAGSSGTQRAEVPCCGDVSTGPSASCSSTSSGSTSTNLCRQLGHRPVLPSNERSGSFRTLPHSGQGICIDAIVHPDQVEPAARPLSHPPRSSYGASGSAAKVGSGDDARRVDQSMS